jgi:hypothetical protein
MMIQDSRARASVLLAEVMALRRAVAGEGRELYRR